MGSQPNFKRSLVGKRPSFHTKTDNGASYRLLLYMFLIVAGIYLLLQKERGLIEPAFMATPTPTRTVNSYILEAQAHFDAGRLDDPDPASSDAIAAYRKALEINPNDANLRAELARILTYSSSLLSTVEQRRQRLAEARAEIDQATELAPESSTVQAVRTFVYDWNANPQIAGELARNYLTEARQSAARALQIDPNNALALAFYAEVLVDQQEWTQAEQYAKQAVALRPDLMDTHRVHGYVLESLSYYNAAIEEYLKAAQINPNLTILYIYIGLNYRTLAGKAAEPQQTQLYEQALDYFSRAAMINETLKVQDPIPYVEIAKTYAQQGEFFVASRNAEKALAFDPTNLNTYGQLGSIYVQARNYEGALPILKCAVEGCAIEADDEDISVDGTSVLFCPLEQGCSLPQNVPSPYPAAGLPLSSQTVAYYYLRYGSVLAAVNLCDQALPVLNQVGQAYPEDTVMRAIIEENYLICGR